MVALSLPALAVPLANTSISWECYGRASTLHHKRDRGSIGLEAGLSYACDIAEEGTDEAGHYFNYESTADVVTSLGPAIPQVGSAAVSAHALNASQFGDTIATAGGGVVFYFAIEPTGTAPWDPPNLPIYFEAHGQGSLTRISDPNPPGGGVSGDYSAYAMLGSTSFRIDGSEFGNNAFSRSAKLTLAPNDPLENPFYTVTLGAGCRVEALGWNRDLPQEGECSAAVDPIIRLDQTAFDELYGPDSFPLADYYSVRFSENVPEPEGGLAAAAVGIALAALGLRKPALASSEKVSADTNERSGVGR
jgi:hypothetical protein